MRELTSDAPVDEEQTADDAGRLREGAYPDELARGEDDE